MRIKLVLIDQTIFFDNVNDYSLTAAGTTGLLIIRHDEYVNDYFRMKFVKNWTVTKEVKGECDNSSVEDLELSTRSFNSLWRANIKTISSLRKYSFNDLKGLRNCGIQSAEEICTKLYEKFGIVLAGFTPKGDSEP